MTAPPWKPFAEAREQIGADQLAKELAAGRMVAIWSDGDGVEQKLSPAHWASARARSTMQSGFWTDLRPGKSLFPISYPILVAPAEAASRGATPHPGGRPATYDWEGALIYLVRHIHDEGLPKTQTALVRVMQDWFDAKGKIPSDTQMKERARRIFEEFSSMGGN
jgi:hypothetical protein